MLAQRLPELWGDTTHHTNDNRVGATLDRPPPTRSGGAANQGVCCDSGRSRSSHPEETSTRRLVPTRKGAQSWRGLVRDYNLLTLVGQAGGTIRI